MPTIPEVRAMDAMPQIARELRRIADSLEVSKEERQPVVRDSLGALALWRQEVFLQHTLLGFSDWLAWHEEGTDAASDSAVP